MKLRKNQGSKKREKSFEISRFLLFSRVDRFWPHNMAGAEGFWTPVCASVYADFEVSAGANRLGIKLAADPSVRLPRPSRRAAPWPEEGAWGDAESVLKWVRIVLCFYQKNTGRSRPSCVFCVTTTKYVRTVLCYKNSPDFFVFRYTYPLVLTGVDSNRYLPGCQRHACNEAYVLLAFGRIVFLMVSLRYRVLTRSCRLTIPHPIPLSLSANFCSIPRFGCITEKCVTTIYLILPCSIFSTISDKSGRSTPDRLDLSITNPTHSQSSCNATTDFKNSILSFSDGSWELVLM